MPNESPCRRFSNEPDRQPEDYQPSSRTPNRSHEEACVYEYNLSDPQPDRA